MKINDMSSLCGRASALCHFLYEKRQENTEMGQYTFMIITLLALAAGVSVLTFFGVKLTDEQYDRLKDIVVKWSGITTFLGVIVATFKIPYGNETITIVAAIGALLAYAMGLSIKNYTESAAPKKDKEAEK